MILHVDTIHCPTFHSLQSHSANLMIVCIENVGSNAIHSLEVKNR